MGSAGQIGESKVHYTITRTKIGMRYMFLENIIKRQNKTGMRKSRSLFPFFSTPHTPPNL